MINDHPCDTGPTAADERLRTTEDRNAIAEGLAQMEAGLAKPAEEAFNEIQERLGFDRPCGR